MKVSARFIEIEVIINKRLEKLIQNLSHNIRDRLRVLFRNGAVLDIRYPIETKYSFNLQYRDKVYRIDTAPYHPEIDTFPNHFHNKEEENIILDQWTDPTRGISDNINAMCDWVLGIFDQIHE
ncbi:MAG: DUF6516 family protein [Candidatus Heimdallarchaeota archaeon]